MVLCTCTRVCLHTFVNPIANLDLHALYPPSPPLCAHDPTQDRIGGVFDQAAGGASLQDLILEVILSLILQEIEMRGGPSTTPTLTSLETAGALGLRLETEY